MRVARGLALRWMAGAGATLGEAVVDDAFARDDVLVRVRVAGICRTDLFVAEGLLEARDGVVLGHELCGVVEAVGRDVDDLALGVRVTAHPYVRCGGCVACEADRPGACERRQQLGVHRDGAFATWVKLPRSALHILPMHLDERAGAFVEPVAAALGVLDAPIDRSSRGAVWGTHRVARLMASVLAASGFDRVELVDAASPRVAPSTFDFIVEATPTEEAMKDMLSAVRPLGCIVLKSRPPKAIALDFARAVEREVTLRAVRYGSFEDAIALLARGALATDELFGSVHPLARFADAFAEARAEERKIFLAPEGT